MKWQKNINQVMAYIEDHLGEDLDMAYICRVMQTSEWEFRRLFSFISQMSLSEYIRKRRLTQAVDRIRAGEKMIDLASLYGYESQAAFSRAFKKQHGISPLQAKNKKAMMMPCPAITFNLFLKEDLLMKKNDHESISIIGGGGAGYALTIDLDEKKIQAINKAFWGDWGNEVVGTTALPLYGAFISEDTCQLLGDLNNKRVLEVGCGRGESLVYVGQRGAGDLWGLDISPDQIHKTRKRLDQAGLKANLICSPMENDCGLPEAYFDLIYSVYGLGWTTDLQATLDKLGSYLKTGGHLIFSWSHPIHKCVALEDDKLCFQKSYFDESFYSVPRRGGTLSLSDRKLSTYINCLAQAGFLVEKMIEETDEALSKGVHSAFASKASVLPVTFVIKARKL